MSDGTLLDTLLKDHKDKFQRQDDFLAGVLVEPGPVGIGDKVRFNHQIDQWIVWNGVRWHPDRRREVYDMVRDCAEGWVGSESLSGDDRKAIIPLFETNKKDHVLRALSARREIAMTGGEWDADPYILGFDNGLLDLRTRQFDPNPSPKTYVSKSVGYNWDPDAKAPLFDRFLYDIMGDDPELVRYLMTLLGYSLFGLQSEQKFWMWVGGGSNGKGALARTMVKVLGDYADRPSDVLYMKNRFGAAPSSAARPDLVRLKGMRFTYMSEPQSKQFNDELLKAHTGEDAILARDLYGKARDADPFAPTHTIIFLTNDPPRVEDVGVSMQRRARIINFNQRFDPPDLTLEPNMERERQGIMALLTKFALIWWNDGNPGLVEPKKITEWSTAYIEENDPLGQFIKSRCAVGRSEKGSAASLWGAYQDWCSATNSEPMSQTGLGLALGRRNFNKKHTSTGAIYTGIRAKNAMELAESDE